MRRQNICERAYAIGVMTPKQHRFDSLESFQELKCLLSTAGAELLSEEFVDLKQFHSSTLFGHGKVESLAEKIRNLLPDLVVVDAELTPVQNRNLEEAWGVRVLDRTGLILDIFAQRAQSKEGKLQVELAQYHYLFPRLIRAWTHLSKQRGGSIGLRGPGETQLEVDRRRVRERITQLKKNLKRVSGTREIHRQKRRSEPLHTMSLIGYTNAGKSTLFNALLRKEATSEDDQLFSTLDPKTRALKLPSGHKILLSDTVGFIKNLPHQLIESFKSTFEEVAGRDLLIHVVDVGHPNRADRVQTVDKVLEELGLNHIPVIKVLNKSDLLPIDTKDILQKEIRDSHVQMSALTGVGLEELKTVIEEKISENYYKTSTLFIPHTEARVLNHLYTYGRVISFQALAEGNVVKVALPHKWENIYRHYQVHLDLTPELAVV